MKRFVFTLAIVICFAAVQNAAAVTPFPGRTFVASTGVDTNPCSRTAPCRSFGAAIAATAPGGEVIVLDSAGYGTTAISGPISLISPSGVYAGVTVTANDGLDIAAGANDVVVLRGLTINGVGGANGIVLTSGGSLYLDDVTVQNFPVSSAVGIDTGATATAARIENCNLRRSGNGLVAHGAPANIHVANSRLEDNVIGVDATAGSSVTLVHTIVAGNSSTGIGPDGGDVTVDDSTIVSNGIGIHSGSTGRASRSLIAYNGVGVLIEAGGAFDSFGDNHLAANTSDGSFGSTLPLH